MSPDWTLSFDEPAILAFMGAADDSKNRQSAAGAAARRAPTRKAAPSTGSQVARPAPHVAPQMARPAAPQAATAVGSVPNPEEDRLLREMIDEIAGESEEALGRFYDMTVSRVYGIALRIVRTPEAAEEVTADVYMQVWREAVRYDESRGRVLGWLLIIARSRSLDYLRRQDEAFSHPEPRELVDEPGSAADDPQNLLSATQTNTRLHAALATLTPVQRQLLSLAFFRGLTHSEIVEHTGMPLGSVKTHIRRALMLLREELGDSLEPSIS